MPDDISEAIEDLRKAWKRYHLEQKLGRPLAPEGALSLVPTDAPDGALSMTTEPGGEISLADD